MTPSRGLNAYQEEHCFFSGIIIFFTFAGHIIISIDTNIRKMAFYVEIDERVFK